MNGPVISIIIPVYNTARYLPRCVESVVAQTFADYECILVDDGSTDSCPQLCGEYARRDARMRVIRKKKGGLSSARNAGIDAAKGGYLFFLDSDDCIPHDALEMLYASIGGAELCAGSHIPFSQKVPSAGKRRRSIKKYTNKSAMKNMLLLRAPYTFLWGKLYRRELFNGLRHADCLYEDVDLMYKIIDKCRAIHCVNRICYFYNLGNANSITASQYTHAHFAGVENAKKMLDFTIKTYPECGRAAKYYFCQMNFHIYRRMLSSSTIPPEDMNIVKSNIRTFMIFGLYDIRSLHKTIPKILLFLLGDRASLFVYRMLSK